MSLWQDSISNLLTYMFPTFIFQDMQWISITSPQAILMSHCLQSMVEELVRTNRTSGGGGGQRLKRPGDGSTQLLTYTHRYLSLTQQGGVAANEIHVLGGTDISEKWQQCPLDIAASTPVTDLCPHPS